jgi:hypothetical protein
MKYIKLFENFEVVEPIIHGDDLNSREISYLEQYGVYCPEYIKKDDGYYYIDNYRCDGIKNVPKMYIKYICDFYDIEDYTINDDYSIDVNGDVDLSHKGLSKIPLKFNKVSGSFICNYNELVTLEGAPNTVGYDFYCWGNKLTTLEGAPNTVGYDFYCWGNKLTTLEGSPNTVGGDFDCRNNKLINLEGAPKEVGGYFDCRNNKLINLEGAPRKVGGEFLV